MPLALGFVPAAVGATAAVGRVIGIGRTLPVTVARTARAGIARQALLRERTILRGRTRNRAFLAGQLLRGDELDPLQGATSFFEGRAGDFKLNQFGSPNRLSRITRETNAIRSELNG